MWLLSFLVSSSKVPTVVRRKQSYTALIILVWFKPYNTKISCYLFSQATKIINTVKLKEEFDYESLCRKLENQVDLLTAEVERQQKLREDDRKELEKDLRESQDSFAEAKKNLISRSEVVVFSLCYFWFNW